VNKDVLILRKSFKTPFTDSLVCMPPTWILCFCRQLGQQQTTTCSTRG